MKNHLFIGLGGQGGKSIAELRKVFHQRKNDAEALKKSGHRWDFLYIDSSEDVTNNRQNWTHFGKNLKLEPSSYLNLKDGGQELNPQALSLRPDVSPWIGDISFLERFLEGSQGIQGANQRRRLGRLLYANNADRIQTAICDKKIGDLTTNGNQCAIHIFASLAGGTGSGSIVDIITMLRTQYPNASVDHGFPIFLYLYTTSDEVEKAQVGYFHQNQYSALRDLNALACGKLKPTLLGSSRGGETYAGEEPFTQIILSTSLNDANERLTLSKQHQIVAESAFERIFAYCNGDLDEDSQKPLTGEDRQPSYPGEPLGNLLRSFRFGSSGMRRWEVPTEEIHDLLANELYLSCFHQLLYQNWDDDRGFVSEKLEGDQSGQAELTQQIIAVIDKQRLVNSKLIEFGKEMANDFGSAHSGMKNGGFKDMDLEGYEQGLRERYQNHLGGKGVDRFFTSLSQNRENRIGDLIKVVKESIKSSWTRTNKPLGLSYVPDVLLEIQDAIRKRAAEESNDTVAGGSQLQTRMEARKLEWAKITLLSRPFKQAELAQAHKGDLINVLKGDIRRRCEEEDQAMLDQLVASIGSLETDFCQCTAKFESWRAKSEERRNELRQALRNLHDDNVANKCELSDDALELFIQKLRIEETHLRNTSDRLLRDAILRVLGRKNLESIGRMEHEQEEVLWEHSDEIIYERATQIHDAIVQRDNQRPVLTSKLLDTLQRRYNEDTEGFTTELKAFIDSATCSAKLDGGQLQPKDIRGDAEMPKMPRTALLLGLPGGGHVFAQKLASMVEPLMSAGDNTAHAVYYHDDPTQIRLLFVASWMASRFTVVTQKLSELYERAIKNDSEGDKVYFTNIDQSGQDGQRPDLLLPTPEESRSAMAASLWLGVRVPVMGAKANLIEAEEGRVILLVKTKDGLEPQELGASLEVIQKQADIRMIAKVCESVAGAVADLDQDQRQLLVAELASEDSKTMSEQGPASTEYAEWVKDRNKINNILKQ